MPTDEDKVKGGDSDAFKRACVLFGIGEYLYGDEPAEPAPPPTSNGNGRGEPRNVPRDRISFPDARAFYGWLKDNGYLAMAEEIGNREDLPIRILHWTPAQIDAATLEILDQTGVPDDHLHHQDPGLQQRLRRVLRSLARRGRPHRDLHPPLLGGSLDRRQAGRSR